MRKAVSGMVIVTIISLILALIALIVIWDFHKKVANFFSEVIMPAIVNMICNIFKPLRWVLGGLSTVVGGILGSMAGGPWGAVIGGAAGAGLGFGGWEWIC